MKKTNRVPVLILVISLAIALSMFLIPRRYEISTGGMPSTVTEKLYQLLTIKN
jgi:hypothetical protein